MEGRPQIASLEQLTVKNSLAYNSVNQSHKKPIEKIEENWNIDKAPEKAIEDLNNLFTVI